MKKGKEVEEEWNSSQEAVGSSAKKCVASGNGVMKGKEKTGIGAVMKRSG